MTKKEKRERLAKIVARLAEVYPSAECALEYGGDPWRLLVMGRLSAQCTDARVNIVCKELFAKYPTAQALAEGDIKDIENIVKPCGLFRTKAANIKDACAMLIDDYNSTSDNLKIHIAAGYAIYDASIDHDLKETRSRADAMMYNNKFTMKQKLNQI